MFHLISMTIERSGDATLYVKGKNHCGNPRALHWEPSASGGAPHQSLFVKWTFSVECAPKLDEHGFLFDQVALGTWFGATIERSRAEPYLSCEEAATYMADRFKHWVKEHYPSCLVNQFTITLSPDPYTSKISAHYVGEK